MQYRDFLNGKQLFLTLFLKKFTSKSSQSTSRKPIYTLIDTLIDPIRTALIYTLIAIYGGVKEAGTVLYRGIIMEGGRAFTLLSHFQHT